MYAKEVRCYKTCYDRYRLKKKLDQQKQQDLITLAFKRHLSDILGPLEEGKVFDMSILRHYYITLLVNYSSSRRSNNEQLHSQSQMSPLKTF